MRRICASVKFTQEVSVMSTTTTTTEIEHTLDILGELLAHTTLEHVSFRLWDGTLWPDKEPRAATIVLKHPGAIHEMFASGTEKGLAEAFFKDDFDVEGDIETACELADVLSENGQGGWLNSARRIFHLRRLARISVPTSINAWTRVGDVDQPMHSKTRDRKAVSFHYDVSNDFYRLWLDSRMLYSCAYFERETDDIETAQAAKLRYICRKLRLRPGDRLLDIGCGWGALALHAAQTHGARVKGVTLSHEQAAYASALINDAGALPAVNVELKDYRDLEDTTGFDAIVSVGMAEHVGEKNLPAYFKKAYSLLKPGGVFLNHAIGDDVRTRPTRGPSFIQEYVFPDSELPSISRTLVAAEAAGFEVRDVENLREHYALTLRHWVRRLEAAHDVALQFVNESTFRVWRLYMAASAHGLECARLAIYQTLLVKPDAHGNSHLPLTRRDWYEIK
jgi:cyclopropane-fatty-acyl-phospholipid synthase